MRNDPVSGARASSPLLRPYIIAVATAGACVLVDAAIGGIRTPYPLAWMALAAIGVATGSFKLNFAANTADIAPGAHVHTHNVASDRGRGDRAEHAGAAAPRLAEPPEEDT